MSDFKGFDAHEIVAVTEERDYALKKWGTVFDDKNTLNDWVTYITLYASQAAQVDIAGDVNEQYAKLIKAANLALTAAYRIRTADVAERHYDAAARAGTINNDQGTHVA